MAVSLQSLADRVLGLFFPDRCAGCGTSGSLFCAACQTKLRPYPHAQTPQPSRATGQPPLLADIAVAFHFEEPLRQAIHRLKYTRVQRMAAPLAALLAQHLHAHALPADALMPVPLHPRRMAERGFNQSELLARHLSALHDMPPLWTGLERSRDTAHQVGLSAHERRENVSDAFVWQHRCQVPPPPRVLLIDDVITTGATLEACARALRAAGAREVRALALARGQ